MSETYLIVRKISEGGMGVVFEASHTRLPLRFAIKILHSAESGEKIPAVALERFKREAQVAATLKNQHVVQIVDYQVAEGGFPYIVMELLEGEDLSARMAREGLLPPQFVMRVVRQVCAALEAAHALGIVHRDLKPANVFLNKHPEPDFVKVLDFGVSKMVDFPTLTQTAALIGTPLYMSPEQAVGGAEVTRSSDLFSLAAFTYEMLTGVRPFDGNSIPTILYQVVHGTPAPVSAKLGPGARAIDEVLTKGLAKNPRDRYASASEFLTALEHAMLAPSSAPGDARVASSDKVSSDERTRVVSGKPVSLAALPEEPTRLLAVPTPPAPTTPAAALGTFTPSPRGDLTASSTQVIPRRALGRLALFGATALLLVAIALAVRRTPTAGSARAPTATAPIAAADTTRPSTRPIPTTARIRVHTTPADARILLDNVPVQGHEAHVPHGPEPHALHVSAAGYLPADRPVEATQDRDVEVVLKPELAATHVDPLTDAALAPPGSAARKHVATKRTPKMTAPVQDL